MIVDITMGYALKQGHPVNRFIINAESTSGGYVSSLINPHLVKDSAITCSDDNLRWIHFMEYRGDSSVVYEIPERYTDAFNLYLKALKIGFPDA